jgi:hypothetical protein
MITPTHPLRHGEACMPWYFDAAPSRHGRLAGYVCGESPVRPRLRQPHKALATRRWPPCGPRCWTRRAAARWTMSGCASRPTEGLTPAARNHDQGRGGGGGAASPTPPRGPSDRAWPGDRNPTSAAEVPLARGEAVGEGKGEGRIPHATTPRGLPHPFSPRLTPRPSPAPRRGASGVARAPAPGAPRRGRGGPGGSRSRTGG